MTITYYQLAFNFYTRLVQQKLGIVWILGLMLCHTAGVGQTVVGMGTDNPNSNAVLELVSNSQNQGFLVPRFTTQQRNASGFTGKLSSKDNGLLVFDTDEGKFFYWFNDTWQQNMGSNVSNGTVWYIGNTIPDNGQGVNGDFYIHQLSGNLYRKQNGIFSLIGNISATAYTAGTGISISANNEIINIGDLDNTNETITEVSLQTGDILRIQEAGVDHDVNLSSFQKTTLNTGQVFVGNAANIATPVTVTGDAALNSDGTATVTGLQGRTVGTVAPSNDQVLTWNGTAWVPGDVMLTRETDQIYWFSSAVNPQAGNFDGGQIGDLFYEYDDERYWRRTGPNPGDWTQITGPGVSVNGKRMNGQLNIGHAPPDPADRQPGMLWLDSSGDGSIKMWTGAGWDILLHGD